MIKPNWEIFRAKFSENPQHNFEWFCYLLFCKEFNKPYGIFRYKNQSAIETNPIEVGDEEIGWQAKFYEASLSNHKEDFLSTIEKSKIKKSKRDYPKTTKLLLYTNQEWGQNKGQITMKFWQENVDRILEFNEHPPIKEIFIRHSNYHPLYPAHTPHLLAGISA